MGLEEKRNAIAKSNLKWINKMHPDVRQKFMNFEKEARENDLDLEIYSSTRTFAEQQRLYNTYIYNKKNNLPYIQAAAPGSSLHEYGFAIDTYVLNIEKGIWRPKQRFLYPRLAKIAAKHGLYWLGSRMNQEVHHFEFNNGNAKKFVSELAKLKYSGKVDQSGFALLNNISIKDPSFDEYNFDEYSTEIGSSGVISSKDRKEINKKEVPKVISKIEEFNAVGIWQIIKLVADQYSLSQNINDATIAFDQGSLLNFVNKVVQDPWLEFFGDTFGNQYYFNVRKQPFDMKGWTESLLVQNLDIDDVFSDELSWYDGPVYSWFQIIPKGSFLGEQDLIFQHVAAVFFEEYAEVWGSKPLSIVSNYLNFMNIGEGKIMLDKAFEDLRYMVESNVYLPFTRSGTITIKGDYKWKRGQRIMYMPTGEEFYIDSVSHSYTITEEGPVFITTLKVSRGMVAKYLKTPTNANAISYWNLVLFDNPPPIKTQYDETVARQSVNVYFDNNRSYLINLSEVFLGKKDTQSKKMQEQIDEFPDLRNKLHEFNIININKSASLIKDFPEATFECVGYVDADKGGKTPKLAKERAETLKARVIKRYMELYSDKSEKQLNSLITTRGSKIIKYKQDAIIDVKGELPSKSQLEKEDNLRELQKKALERFAEFVVKEHKAKKTKDVPQEGIGWKVNDPVFQFFLKRKQQNEC